MTDHRPAPGRDQDRNPRRGRVSWPLAAIFPAFACLCAPAASAQPSATSRQTYVISSFDSIRLEAAADVEIVTGKGASAIGTGDRAALDSLRLQMSGDTLIIRMNRPAIGAVTRARGPVRLKLTTGTLGRVTLLGPGTLTADEVKSRHVEATLRGGGTLRLPRIEADRLTADLLGSGTMTLAGRASDMTSTASGSGRIDATGLAANRLRADLDGSADARFFARDNAILVAAGSGSLIVTGKASCTVRKLGNAQVECGGVAY